MSHAYQVTLMQSDWVGRVIDGRFTLTEWIGGSSHSSVFLTSLPGTPSQKAAIKLIPAEAGSHDPLANFKLRAELSHPHLIRVFDFGATVIDGMKYLYVVTEYAEEILASLLPNRAMTTEEVKELIPPVLDALGYLHSQRLVHSRLKPSNILVVNDKLKLSTDCVRAATESAHDKAPLSIYDAPERARGMLTRSCDLWSLGVTIVEAFTQKTPEWNRAGNSSPHVPESIPQPYRKVAEICLRIDPGERANINDVKRNLGIPVVQPKPRVAAMPEAHRQPEAHLQPEPNPHPEVPRLRSIERNFSQKPRSGMAVVALLVLFAVAALLWMYSHGSMPAMPSFASHSNNQPPEGTTAPGTSAPQTSAHTQSPSDEQGPSDQNEKPVQRGKSAAQNQQQPPQVAARPESQAQPQQAPIPAKRANGGYGYEVGFVTKRVMPNVAPSASRTIRGTINVVVRVNVDPSGNVSYAGFQYPGSSRYFSKVAMDAARQWKFKPAIANGRPVASAWTLHFAFNRDRTLVTPAPSAP
jgi:TonB family protein